MPLIPVSHGQVSLPHELGLPPGGSSTVAVLLGGVLGGLGFGGLAGAGGAVAWWTMRSIMATPRESGGDAGVPGDVTL